MTDECILSLFEEWNSSLQTGVASNMLKLYADSAILLPTISNQVRHNHSEILDYFEFFLPQGPSGKIEEANIRIFDSLAINSGIYLFSFKNGSTVRARYTFVYQKLDGQWKIIEHHSSAMPE